MSREKWMNMHRRAFLRYAGATAAGVALAMQGYTPRRVLPPELKPLIPPVLANPDYTVPIVEAKGPLPDSTKVEYVAEQWAECKDIPLVVSKFSSPYNGSGVFKSKFSPKTSRLYGIGIWTSEKKMRNLDVLNLYIDTKNDLGKKPKKDDLGLIVGIDVDGRTLVRVNPDGSVWPRFAYSLDRKAISEVRGQISQNRYNRNPGTLGCTFCLFRAGIRLHGRI